MQVPPLTLVLRVFRVLLVWQALQSGPVLKELRAFRVQLDLPLTLVLKVLRAFRELRASRALQVLRVLRVLRVFRVLLV